MTKKNQFKQKLLLWPHDPFKNGAISKSANYFVRNIKSQYTMLNDKAHINLNPFLPNAPSL